MKNLATLSPFLIPVAFIIFGVRSCQQDFARQHASYRDVPQTRTREETPKVTVYVYREPETPKVEITKATLKSPPSLEVASAKPRPTILYPATTVASAKPELPDLAPYLVVTIAKIESSAVQSKAIVNIDNTTDDDRTVYVNDKKVTVPPKKKLDVVVKPGVFTYKILGVNDEVQTREVPAGESFNLIIRAKILVSEPVKAEKKEERQPVAAPVVIYYYQPYVVPYGGCGRR